MIKAVYDSLNVPIQGSRNLNFTELFGDAF
jgi:hypothetical protein